MKGLRRPCCADSLAHGLQPDPQRRNFMSTTMWILVIVVVVLVFGGGGGYYWSRNR
jgi:hypothetical protein